MRNNRWQAQLLTWLRCFTRKRVNQRAWKPTEARRFARGSEDFE